MGPRPSLILAVNNMLEEEGSPVEGKLIPVHLLNKIDRPLTMSVLLSSAWRMVTLTWYFFSIQCAICLVLVSKSFLAIAEEKDNSF